ncbi:MAG: 4-hydroxy-tetrahydrodipicolinate synthase [Planctomycetes bacterium]|nr:4-hydroxy-tetrahydrodipicolinate synthase [Planctomycetota bacterium]
MFEGCYTALVTPMKAENSEEIDYRALKELVEFQIAGGISGILAMGTTGESPTLNWEEHSRVIVQVGEFAADRCIIIAGTGSNCTREAIDSTRHVAAHNVDAVLLVEPYYNGPSSLEIRREYMGVVADEFPELEVIPYVIPGRSGTQILPEDVALLAQKYDNINAVKEASGDLDNMRRTRECAGDDFQILSGDDGLTYTMMTDETICGSGVVSVMSNVTPAAIQQMTQALLNGKMDEGERLYKALKPLFGIVTVKTQEETPWGGRLCKARNPLPVKTLMDILGMPVGATRQPLGKMTRQGADIVLEAARTVWQNNPEILEPVARAFQVDIDKRLTDPDLAPLCYSEE